MDTKAFDNQPQFLGHPIGLIILFFTEMWERFSYYGMRAILVIFLTGVVTGKDHQVTMYHGGRHEQEVQWVTSSEYKAVVKRW